MGLTSVRKALPVRVVDAFHKPEIHNACSTQKSRRIALFTSFGGVGINCFYHWVTDYMLTTFIAAGTVASDFGCDAKGVDVHVLFAHRQRNSKFNAVWTSLFGHIRQDDDLDGCYQAVVFGTMAMQTFIGHIGYPDSKWNFNHQAWVKDSAMASWAVAYSSALRRRWQVLDIRPPATDTMVLAYQKRAPAFMLEFAWNRTGIQTDFLHLGKLSMDEQIRRAGKARGMISVSGSAFTHQFFMRPGSAMFVISDRFVQGKGQDKSNVSCKYSYQSWHDTTALHLGHSILHWLFCESEAEFRLADPSRLLMKLLRESDEAALKRQAWVCLITRPSSQLWSAHRDAHCDKVVTMPVVEQRQLPSCGAFPEIGLPFRPDSPWSVLMRDTYDDFAWKVVHPVEEAKRTSLTVASQTST